MLRGAYRLPARQRRAPPLGRCRLADALPCGVFYAARFVRGSLKVLRAFRVYELEQMATFHIDIIGMICKPLLNVDENTTRTYPSCTPQTPTSHVIAELPFPDPPLADDAIRLRPWRGDDASAARDAAQDEMITRYTRIPEGRTEQQWRESVANDERARLAGVSLALAIAELQSDLLLGAISLIEPQWPAARAEIGYWVAPWGRGRGAAARAVRLLSRWAINELRLERVALHTHLDNVASQIVAEHAGFHREGILRSIEEWQGSRCDFVLYSLVRADLE
jgi:RimJ/RimL family protein N-acetyltransferase